MYSSSRASASPARGTRPDHVSPHPSPVQQPPGANHLDLRALVVHAPQKGVVCQRPLGIAGDVDRLDLEGVEDVQKSAYVIGVRVAHRLSPDFVETSARSPSEPSNAAPTSSGPSTMNVPSSSTDPSVPTVAVRPSIL